MRFNRNKFADKIIHWNGTNFVDDTLEVLIFAGTNFREFFSPYIRGYLFSRMSFYSTFAGTNFGESVISEIFRGY